MILLDTIRSSLYPQTHSSLMELQFYFMDFFSLMSLEYIVSFMDSGVVYLGRS